MFHWEIASKKRHFLFPPHFKESTALLQFDTKKSLKDSFITFVFPFDFGPRYLELKRKEEDDLRCPCNGCMHHSVIYKQTCMHHVFFSLLFDFSVKSLQYSGHKQSPLPSFQLIDFLTAVWARCAFLICYRFKSKGGETDCINGTQMVKIRYVSKQTVGRVDGEFD